MILTLGRIQMLLVNAVVVVAKLVHENVQERERPCLRFREATRDTILQPVMRNAEPLENVPVKIKIWRREIYPKVIAPSMEKYRSSFLSMVKLIESITAIVVAIQHDALQTLGEPIPLWNDVNERLHTSFGENVTESAPG